MRDVLLESILGHKAIDLYTEHLYFMNFLCLVKQTLYTRNVSRAESRTNIKYKNHCENFKYQVNVYFNKHL